ncbi:Histidine kinase-%2C DNA gyrase B-%2C and HSP90-like ATPase [uncultured Clostridium sp.]|nr:Histidine kinase-%2C DNA gyrase B-%2C and HSP90-like ATPase [uncultured Clostridium sp.]
MSGIFLPKVKDCSVFKEIALNTVNQLEILREALSNSDDANADKIYIYIERDLDGEFIITIQDNGVGMNVEEIHKFFDLGFSYKRFNQIGEKGLGTKIFYKSNNIYIETNNKEGNSYSANMKNSWEILEQGKVPQYEIKEHKGLFNKGTKIQIKGYKIDNPEQLFNIETIKDYIQWFTIGGSFRNIFANNIKIRNLVNNIDVVPQIIIDDKINHKCEIIAGMHQFEEPNENPIVNLEQLKYKRSSDYSRPFGPFNRETNINGEYISVQVYGTVSGVNARNKICRLKYDETHKSRFGLYLCKDFIPCTKMDSLIGTEEYEHYHIMANSQNFKLTSDRNNISNIDDFKIKWILDQIKDIVDNQIRPIAEREYFNMIKNEEEEYETQRKCERTIKNINKIYRSEDLDIDNLPILKIPRNEIETALLFVSILSNENTQYSIKRYIDKVASYSAKLPTDMVCIDSKGETYLVEIEFKLSNFLKHKHPIQTVDYIVCWKIDIEENKSYKANNETCVFVSNNENRYLAFNEKEIYIIELKSIIDSIKSREI